MIIHKANEWEKTKYEERRGEMKVGCGIFQAVCLPLFQTPLFLELMLTPGLQIDLNYNCVFLFL